MSVPFKRKPRVLIIVEGGVVQDVIADGQIEYKIKDWDNIEGGDAQIYLNDDTFDPPGRVVSRKKLDGERVVGVKHYLPETKKE